MSETKLSNFGVLMEHLMYLTYLSVFQPNKHNSGILS